MRVCISILFLLCLSLSAQHEMKRMSIGSLHLPSASGSPTPDILWWKLNDGSGTTVTATVGPNGTTDAAWVTGKSGSGFALDCNGSSHDGASDSSVTYGSQVITVCFWLWIDTTTGTDVIVESSANFNTPSGTFLIYYAGASFGASMHDTGYRVETITTPATGAWHHFAIVFDNSTAAGDSKIYLNGVNQSTSVTTTKNTAATTFSAQTLYLASRARTSLWMDGRIDDLRIYLGDRSADVTAIMNDAQ